MTTPPPPTTIICAAAGCHQPVARGGRGRPRIYCSPACRPSGPRHNPDATRRAAGELIVEVDHDPMPDNSRPTGRIWKVQLRRAGRTVVIATELGRPSADHLAGQIAALLNPLPRAPPTAIE